MRIIDRYNEHLQQKNARFRDKHPGAKRASGNAGGNPYPYIAYHESNAAAFLELCSILAVVFGMGLMIVVPADDSDVLTYLAWAAGTVIVNRLLAVLARIVNDVQVRHKISTDTEYARYFAVVYPEQAHICTELNEIYALNPDAEPAPDTRMQLESDAKRDETLKRIITIVSLSVLGALFLALMAFCFWAMYHI